MVARLHSRDAHRTSFTAGALALAALVGGLAPLASAQTDYYNTDAGRPILIEDAYATERHAFELQLAPVRLERMGGGVYAWGIEPEIAWGFLPRTHIEIGAPLAWVDAGLAGRTAGLAGLDVSLLHNLNVETAIPALAIVADVLVPAGGLGPDKAYPSLKGIATRTFTWARFPANARYTFGEEPAAGGSGGIELSRWLAGLAVDRTFPLESLLLTAELYALQPIEEGADTEWNAAAGARYQLAPVFALDAGFGRRLTGEDRSWFVTFGLARAFGVRSLMPR